MLLIGSDWLEMLTCRDTKAVYLMQLCQHFLWKQNHLLLGSASDLVLSRLSSEQSKHLSPPREKGRKKIHLLYANCFAIHLEAVRSFHGVHQDCYYLSITQWSEPTRLYILWLLPLSAPCLWHLGCFTLWQTDPFLLHNADFWKRISSDLTGH